MSRAKRKIQIKDKDSKKYLKKGKEKNPKRENDEKFSVKQTNSPEFYTVNPELVNNGATLSYSDMLGLQVEIRPGEELDDISLRSAVPGIMVHEYVHTIGVSENLASNVNVTARNIYTYVRHWNSGQSNYEAPDLMMMLLACGSIIDFLQSIRRIYGIMMSYSVTNRYWSKALVEALGWDYDDVVTHLSDLRYLYNLAVAKFSRIAIPKNLYYYDRCAMLQAHIYADGPTSKAQLHALKARSYYKFDGFGSDTGSQLITVQPSSGLITFAQASEFINTLLNDLLSNEDIGNMSGDLLKSYGEGNLFTMPALEETYTIQPIYDENMLHQFMNINSAGLPAKLTVSQNDGYIVCRPYYENVLETGTALYCGNKVNRVINTFKDSVQPVDNIEFSRFLVTMKDAVINEDQTAYTAEIASCGTEIIVSSIVYTLDETGTPQSTIGYTMRGTSEGFVIDSNCFDYRPILIVPVNLNGDGNNTCFIGPIQNYVVISPAVVAKLHNIALLSLFTSYGAKTF